jgi:histidinol-phosphate aminotransferase
LSARRADVRSLLRPDVWARREYEAPETVESVAAKRGLDAASILKLDQNENPFGCSPRVAESLSRCDRFHIYPDPLARECRAAIAGYAGAPVERVVMGNGCDEVIEVLFRLFLSPGDSVLSFGPTFGYYATVAGTCGASVKALDRRADWSVDVDAALSSLDERTKVIVVASPNNPTGNLTALDDLARLAGSDRLLIVDEAYFEFAGSTAIPLALSKDNVAVLRTFSKWAGLAGMRAGYGILPEWLVPQYMKFKPPYGVSVAAMVAVLASLEDRAYLLGTVDVICRERERLFGLLRQPGYLLPWPSSSNFLLVALARGDGEAVRLALEERGILVRTYSDARLARAVRFTVGRPEQNDRLVQALAEVRETI